MTEVNRHTGKMRRYFTHATIINFQGNSGDLPCSLLYCLEKYRHIFLLCPGLQENDSTNKKRRALDIYMSKGGAFAHYIALKKGGRFFLYVLSFR
jgi:hypothetical protein